MRGKWMMVRTVAAAVLVLVAVGAGSASAKDRVYWSNFGNAISFANLDNSGGGSISTAGSSIDNPAGVGIDTATGRIFWNNANGTVGMSFANLDGSGGGGNVTLSGGTTSSNWGLTLDPGSRHLYWSNGSGNSISTALVDGSGGAIVPIIGTTVSNPRGVAVDPVAGRIYWVNFGGGIDFASLNGSGGGTVNTAGATVNQPFGLAIDSAGGRVYWANLGAGISYANLNGSGGGNVDTTGATVSSPKAIAIDRSANRIYWVNGPGVGGGISFARLDGTGGGGDLSTSGATVSALEYLALLKAPIGAGAPGVTGGSLVGSTLTCSPGAWAPNLVSAFLYQAPQSFAYHWNVGGLDLAATASSITATIPGDYRCTVTATNAAGSTAQTSAPHAVSTPPPPPPPPPPPGRLRISTIGTWSVSNSGVQIGSMTVRGLRKGAKVKLTCSSCHVKQTLTAKGSTLKLKKLGRKLLRRKKSFTVMATLPGFVGDQITLTVKNYGHKHKDLVREARAPFKAKHLCVPVGRTKAQKTC
jgi:hypothetical protein